MNVYFISDCHLKFRENQEDRERRERVTAFLEHIADHAHVLVLGGDVFDLWFTWRTVMIKDYFPVLVALARLREKGCRIIYLAGNHDFRLHGFFDTQLGFEVYPEFFSGVLDGHRTFVAHGDCYTFHDKRYKLFRFLVRNPLVMGCFELLHPDFGLRIGLILSRSSRAHQASEKTRRAKERGLFVEARKRAQSHDLVVMGHSHLPCRMRIGNSWYFNTGDWLRHNTFLLSEDGQLQLYTVSSAMDITPVTPNADPNGD